jgi:hypothetical protein
MREMRDPGCDNQNVSPTPAQQARAARIAAEIAALASHGPYHQRTRKKDGKTATRILTDDQLADYRPWFDNHRRLRELITELEALSLDIAEADPRWNR